MQGNSTHDSTNDDLTRLAAAREVAREKGEDFERDGTFDNEVVPEDDIQQNPVNIQYDDPELNEAKKEERKRKEAERAEMLEKELDQ